MAGVSGDTSPALKNQLLTHPQSFAFSQLIRLLERILGESLSETRKIQVRPALSFDYPESEVLEVQESETDRYEVLTTFLGLYGISSPLPPWYTESLIEAELEDRAAARMLLDIIQQRLYSLYYQSSAKYQFLQKVVEAQDSRCHDKLYLFLGIRPESINRPIPSPDALLRYITLFRQQPRSAEGLRVLLEDALPGVKADIQQCVERKVRIPEFQRSVLGVSGQRLGVDTVLGQELDDCTGKILIVLGPVPLERFHQLLNGSQECQMMLFLIEAYINVPLDCDLELILEQGEARTARLGVPELSCLGKNTWIFSGAMEESLSARLSFNFTKASI